MFHYLHNCMMQLSLSAGISCNCFPVRENEMSSISLVMSMLTPIYGSHHLLCICTADLHLFHFKWSSVYAIEKGVGFAP